MSGEQALAQLLKFVECTFDDGTVNDVQAAIAEFAQRVSDCRNIFSGALLLQTDDSNRTLHLADYGMTAYTGVLDIVKAKAELVSKLYYQAFTYGKVLPKAELRELKDLLSTIGLGASTKYIVIRVGTDYFAGLDSKGSPVFGPFERAYTVGTRILRYVFETMLESKGLEFIEETAAPIDQMSDIIPVPNPYPQHSMELASIDTKLKEMFKKHGGSPDTVSGYSEKDKRVWVMLSRRREEIAGVPPAPKRKEEQADATSPVGALDPRYQSELDKITRKMEALMRKFGGTPDQRKYGAEDCALWDNLERRYQELSGTGSYASSTSAVSGGKDKGTVSNVQRMSLD